MATFRLIGDAGGAAAAVTARLGIEPTRAAEAGDPVSVRRPARVHEVSGWWLSSASSPEDGVELGVALRRVLDRLDPVAPVLWDLEREGYWANWFCYLGSDALEHAAELDRDTLGRLLALPGELWLDVYGDYDDDQP